MRIDDIEITERSCQARITWENSGRLAETIFFEFQMPTFDLEPDGLGNALFVSCAVLALWRGEERLKIDLPVCPLLYQNVLESLEYIRHWFYGKEMAEIPKIEVDLEKDYIQYPRSRSSAIFFSGGVDSMFSLRFNHDLFPIAHSLRITRGILVGGFEITDPTAFRIAEAHLRLAAESADIELLVINTNLYSICRPDDPYIEFLIQQFEGAFFASIAHLLGRLISRIVLATTLDIRHMAPNGTHPLLRYSSSSLDFSVDGTTYDRLKKAQFLVGWTPAMHFLRVCNKTERYQVGQINCGRCNKCVGAMLMFFSLGALNEVETLRDFRLTPTLVTENLTPRVPFQQTLGREIVERLRNQNEVELARAVESQLSIYKD